MKLIKSLFSWFPMYLLVGILILAIIWEENLRILPKEHMILGGAFLIVFGILANFWVTRHEIDEIMDRIKSCKSAKDQSNCEHLYTNELFVEKTK